MDSLLNLIQPNPNIPATFIGNAGVSTDGLGTDSLGTIQAEIPEDSTIEFAFLHVATRTFNQPFRPTSIGFENTEVPIVFLDNVLDARGVNFETGRADVTSLVAEKVGSDSGVFDFTVDETVTGSPEFVEGTSLTVIYSNPSFPEQTIIVLEGGLTGQTPQTNILSLGTSLNVDNPDFIAELALGVQFGILVGGFGSQFSTIDVNGSRLTSSAGDFDDGEDSDGQLITVGGVGDLATNPVDPFNNRDSNDDELYDLTPFLQTGDTAIQFDTANPSDDDSIFLAVLSLSGFASVDRVIADNAGNTLATARDLSVLIGRQTFSDFIGDVDANDYYRFDLIENSNFDLTFSNLSADADIAILDRRGVPIETASAGDGLNGTTNLELDAGTYFIRVSRFDAALTPYDLELNVTPTPPPFQIRRVSPARGSSAGQTTVTIFGNQFTPDASVSLTDEAGVERVATNVTWIDDETLSATFDLTGLSVGLYDINVSDTPGTATDSDAFNVNVGAVGEVEVFVSAPRRVRPFGSQEVTVTYQNVGETDAVAPLLNLQADGARLQRPGEEAFTEDEIQFLAINNEGLAGILPPGARGSFTVEFEPTVEAGEQIDFSVSTIDPEEIVNWEEFREELRPTLLNPEAWNEIYDNFTASAGVTARDYQQILVDNANYLSQQGEYVADGNRLVGFEFQQASDYQALAQRNSLGAFGRGRFFVGDIQAVADDEGNVIIENAGTLRLFTLQEDGSYLPATGDFGRLTLDGGIYRLEEQGGTVTVFRADGGLDFIEDTNGNRITAQYNGSQLTGLAAGNGDRLTFTRNSSERITSVTDSAGRTTTYTYDGTGELLLSVASPEGTTSYTYDENFALTSITDGNGTQATFAYDDRGRLIRESFNEGAEEITYSYGDNGEVTVTDASGATTQLFLNDRGQVAQLEDALGRTLRIGYDEAGNPTRVTAPDNSVLGFTYDDQGNLVSQVDPLGQRTSFTYEPNFDLLQSVTDPRGNAIAYDYDESGNLLSINYADASSETFDYDEEGNVTQSANRRGQEISYDYNPRGQLLRQDNADGSFFGYTYDDRGNLTSATDASGTTTLQYDSGDRLTNITYANGRSLAYTYDAGGRRTSMTDSSGNTVNYSYDSAGRLAGLTDGNGNSTVAYAYDAIGRLTREENGNGTYTTYTYDPAGQLTEIANFAPDDSANSRYNYRYDELGQQTGVTTLDGEWTYSYDAIGQLTGAVFASTNPEISDRDLTYVYDAAGNRIRTIDNGETTQYTTNNLNRYESAGEVVYDYDADGNLISKTEGDRIWTYEYNNENRLVKVVEPDGVETEYEYDPLGNRIATVYNGERTEYLIDPFGLGDVVGEYDGAGNLVANYTHGIGLVSRNGGGESAYYDSNAIGSTVGLTNAAGNEVNSYSYLPFGRELSESETIENSFEFVGQWGVMEENNGLDFMRARFYDGETGRFTSPDSIGLLGGDTNLYTYTLNNPNNVSDPSGNILPFLVGLAARTIATRLISSLATRTAIKTVGQAVLLDGVTNAGLEFAEDALCGRELEFSNFGRDLLNGAISGSAKEILNLPGVKRIARKGNLYYSDYAGINNTVSGQIGNLLSPEDNKASGNPYASAGIDYLSGRAGFYLPNNVVSKVLQSAANKGLKLAIDGCGDPETHNEDPDIPFPQNLANQNTDVVTSFDPNDIIGPAGFGPEGWLASPQVLPYTVRFENIGEIAAVLVNITHPLDADLDLNTFELGDFGFGDLVIDVPDGFQNYSERLDLRDSIGAFVDFDANLNLDTRTVTWTLTTIDPETGELATGVEDGFLPPNVNGSGEGFVRYQVEPQANLPTGTALDAQASIVFDTNEPIITPPVLNTIDIGDPTSTVTPLPANSNGEEFLVSWEGMDDGSGVGSYDIFVSVDGQPFELWLDDTPETSATYTGEIGKTYGFYSQATDNVGYQETAIAQPQASITATPGTNPNAIVGSENSDVLFGGDAGEPFDSIDFLKVFAILPEDVNPLLEDEDPDFLSEDRDEVLDGKGGLDVVLGGGGNDRLIGGTQNDFLLGGSGGDFLVGVNPNASRPGEGEIDVLIGGSGGDTFAIGDATGSYYQDKATDDYAVIFDFDPSQDIIELHGNSTDYQIESTPENLPSGSGIFHRTSGALELVAIVRGESSLNLDDRAFSFVA